MDTVDLLNLFNNGEEDLIANRVGQLSGEQSRRLLFSFFQVTIFALLFCSMIAMIVISMVIALDIPNLIPALLILGSFVAFFYSFVKPLYLKGMDLREKQVEHVQGPAYLIEDGAGDNRSYYIEIGNKKFGINWKIYHTIVRSRIPYKAYYTPHSLTLVALEIMKP